MELVPEAQKRMRLAEHTGYNCGRANEGREFSHPLQVELRTERSCTLNQVKSLQSRITAQLIHLGLEGNSQGLYMFSMGKALGSIPRTKANKHARVIYENQGFALNVFQVREELT